MRLAAGAFGPALRVMRPTVRHSRTPTAFGALQGRRRPTRSRSDDLSSGNPSEGALIEGAQRRLDYAYPRSPFGDVLRVDVWATRGNGHCLTMRSERLGRETHRGREIALLWPHVLLLMRRLTKDADADATTTRRISASATLAGSRCQRCLTGER